MTRPQKIVRVYPNLRLREAIRAKGKSMSMAAHELGMHISTLSRMALGWVIPKPEMKAKLAAYVGKRVDELWPEAAPGHAGPENN